MIFSQSSTKAIYDGFIAPLAGSSISISGLADSASFSEFRTKFYVLIAKLDCSVASAHYPRRRAVTLLYMLMKGDCNDDEFQALHKQVHTYNDFITLETGEQSFPRLWKHGKAKVKPTRVDICTVAEDTYSDEIPSTHLLKASMSHIFYEVKEFVNGVEADKLSDDALIEAARKCDERIAEIQDLSFESSKVREMVDDLTNQRSSILAVLDAR